MGPEDHLSPDEVDLVATALTSGTEAARHWRAFTTKLDFEDIWDAERYSMLPSVHMALRDVAGLDEAPRLAGIHRRTWVANQTAIAQGRAGAVALADAGIACCLHGGLALALGTYDDPATRVAPNAELLVADRDVPAALDAVATLGWEPLGAPDATLEVGDNIVLGRDTERMGISWETCRGIADSAADRAAVPAVIDGAFTVDTRHGPVGISPPVALALTALCGGVGSKPDQRLRCLVDLARLLERGVDIDATAERVDALGVVTVARHTVGLAGQVGVDVDDLSAALARLRADARDRRRHDLVIRAAASDSHMHPLRVAHARHAVGRDTGDVVRSLPRFLSHAWGLDSPLELVAEVPRRAVSKASRTLRSRREAS